MIKFLLGFYALMITALYFLQEKMIFFPIFDKFEDCTEMTTLGALPFKLEYQGQKLRFYMRKATQARVNILFFHGNGGSACMRSYLAQGLQDLPVNLIFPEYPGYSRGTGHPSQKEFLKNALALYDYMANENNLPFLYFGESMGSAVSVYLASQRSTKALLLQAPFTSIADVGAYHYPYFPVRFMLKHPFPAHKWAPLVECPTLMIHGTEDEIIPIKFGRRLAKLFKAPVKFVEIERADHNGLPFSDPNLYWSSIRDFVLKNIIASPDDL